MGGVMPSSVPVLHLNINFHDMMRHKLIILLTVTVLSAVSCDRSFVFMQLTDTQIGFRDKTEGYAWSDSLMQAAVAAVNRVHPACVVITGDLVNRTSDSLQVAIYKRNLAGIDSSIPVYALPGNHDMRPWTEENHAAFLAFNGYDRFSFKMKGCAFIGFDSCCIKDSIETVEKEQLAWLEGELRKARKCRQIYLFTHCPVIRESIDEEEDYFNFPIPKRREYIDLFKKYGVTALFAGHTHTYYHTSFEGIEFITAGPVGAPLHGGFSGVNVVKVSGKGFSNEYVPAGDA